MYMAVLWEDIATCVLFSMLIVHTCRLCIMCSNPSPPQLIAEFRTSSHPPVNI